MQSRMAGEKKRSAIGRTRNGMSHCVRPSTLTCSICKQTVQRQGFRDNHLPACRAARDRDAEKAKAATTRETAREAETDESAHASAEKGFP